MLKPGVPCSHDEGADLGGAVVARAGLGGDDVGARLAGVGDEALAAVDDPVAAALAVLLEAARSCACRRSRSRRSGSVSP